MTTPTITRIHDVLTQLTPLIAGAVPEGVKVWDGPRLAEFPEELVLLGFSSDPQTTPPYTCRYAQQDGMGAHRYVETFAIRALVSVTVRGDEAVAAARGRAVEIIEAIDTVLRAHQVLRGVWDDIGVGDTEIEWFPIPLDLSGTNVSAFMSIEGTALL